MSPSFISKALSNTSITKLYTVLVFYSLNSHSSINHHEGMHIYKQGSANFSIKDQIVNMSGLAAFLALSLLLTSAAIMKSKDRKYTNQGDHVLISGS